MPEHYRIDTAINFPRYFCTRLTCGFITTDEELMREHQKIIHRPLPPLDPIFKVEPQPEGDTNDPPVEVGEEG